MGGMEQETERKGRSVTDKTYFKTPEGDWISTDDISAAVNRYDHTAIKLSGGGEVLTALKPREVIEIITDSNMKAH